MSCGTRGLGEEPIENMLRQLQLHGALAPESPQHHSSFGSTVRWLRFVAVRRALKRPLLAFH